MADLTLSCMMHLGGGVNLYTPVVLLRDFLPLAFRAGRPAGRISVKAIGRAAFGLPISSHEASITN
jgi:hypothetical protein